MAVPRRRLRSPRRRQRQRRKGVGAVRFRGPEVRVAEVDELLVPLSVRRQRDIVEGNRHAVAHAVMLRRRRGGGGPRTVGEVPALASRHARSGDHRRGRTPVGRRNGALSGVHPADLLGTALTALVERTGIDPGVVGQLVSGCVSQVGEQSFNIGRTAWLAAGLPLTTAATTVDTQCGSSQQAANLAASLVASGAVDVAVAAGVESMTRIPIGSNSSKKLGLGVPIPKSYFGRYEFTSQFEGAERIAEKWGISRRRHRCLRASVPATGRPGVGGGSLRHSDHRGRRPDGGR